MDKAGSLAQHLGLRPGRPISEAAGYAPARVFTADGGLSPLLASGCCRLRRQEVDAATAQRKSSGRMERMLGPPPARQSHGGGGGSPQSAAPGAHWSRAGMSFRRLLLPRKMGRSLQGCRPLESPHPTACVLPMTFGSDFRECDFRFSASGRQNPCM